MDHIKAIETELQVSREDEERAVAKLGEAEMNLMRLAGNVGQLHAEKQLLEDSSRVPVTQAVYEAFNTVLRAWRQRFSEDEIAGFLLNPEGFSKTSEHAKTLSCFALTDPIKYTLAIAKGYTLEPQTTEDRIEAKLTAALEESGIECPIPVSHFAQQLTRAVREALAEQQQEN
jgi:hypothetical protein